MPYLFGSKNRLDAPALARYISSTMNRHDESAPEKRRQVNIRLDAGLYREFKVIATARGKGPGVEFDDFMRAYNDEHRSVLAALSAAA